MVGADETTAAGLKMDIFIQKKSSKEINSNGGSPGLVVKGRDS